MLAYRYFLLRIINWEAGAEKRRSPQPTDKQQRKGCHLQSQKAPVARPVVCNCQPAPRDESAREERR